MQCPIQKLQSKFTFYVAITQDYISSTNNDYVWREELKCKPMKMVGVMFEQQMLFGCFSSLFFPLLGNSHILGLKEI